jgi:hypothetical protein
VIRETALLQFALDCNAVDCSRSGRRDGRRQSA